MFTEPCRGLGVRAAEQTGGRSCFQDLWPTAAAPSSTVGAVSEQPRVVRSIQTPVLDGSPSLFLYEGASWSVQGNNPEQAEENFISSGFCGKHCSRTAKGVKGQQQSRLWEPWAAVTHPWGRTDLAQGCLSLAGARGAPATFLPRVWPCFQPHSTGHSVPSCNCHCSPQTPKNISCVMSEPPKGSKDSCQCCKYVPDLPFK